MLFTQITTRAEIEMPFELWIRVGPRKHVLDGVQMAQQEGALLGQFLAHCKAQDFGGCGETVRCAKGVDRC